MLTVSRPLATLALVSVVLVLLAAPHASASEKTPLRSTAPSHVDKPSDHDADHPARVRVPHRTAEKTHPDTEKVNINNADVKELMTLAGVGRKVAEKIVEYRDTHGPFKKADEIRKVDGIGNGVWEKNRERIVIK
jgi:competence ComEA-like helix-hairpin-helix protein